MLCPHLQEVIRVEWGAAIPSLVESSAESVSVVDWVTRY